MDKYYFVKNKFQTAVLSPFLIKYSYVNKHYILSVKLRRIMVSNDVKTEYVTADIESRYKFYG